MCRCRCRVTGSFGNAEVLNKKVPPDREMKWDLPPEHSHEALSFPKLGL
jgi:hypothetical protein